MPITLRKLKAYIRGKKQYAEDVGLLTRFNHLAVQLHQKGATSLSRANVQYVLGRQGLGGGASGTRSKTKARKKQQPQTQEEQKEDNNTSSKQKGRSRNKSGSNSKKKSDNQKNNSSDNGDNAKTNNQKKISTLDNYESLKTDFRDVLHKIFPHYSFEEDDTDNLVTKDLLYLNLINILKEYKKVNREQGIKKIIKQFKKDIAEEDSDSITKTYEFSKDGSVNLHKSTKKDDVREVNTKQYVQIVEKYYAKKKGNIILPKKYEDTATAEKIKVAVSQKKTDKIDFDTATQKKFLKNIQEQVDEFVNRLPADEPRRKVNSKTTDTTLSDENLRELRERVDNLQSVSENSSDDSESELSNGLHANNLIIPVESTRSENFNDDDDSFGDLSEEDIERLEVHAEQQPRNNTEDWHKVNN